MRRPFLPMLIVALAAVASPALADSRAASADARVVQTQHQLMRAQQSGDAASIADARSKFVAAKAVAWGARHPAKQPTVKISAQR